MFENLFVIILSGFLLLVLKGEKTHEIHKNITQYTVKLHTLPTFQAVPS